MVTSNSGLSFLPINCLYQKLKTYGHVIRKYNYKIKKDSAPSITKTCNCGQKTDCPFDGNCIVNTELFKYVWEWKEKDIIFLIGTLL